MAKLMSFTDPQNGLTAPQSYWKVGGIYLDEIAQRGRIVFIGYASQAQRLEHPEGSAWSHEYVLTPERYEALFSAAALDAAGKNVKAYCYDVANLIDNFFASATDLL